MTEISLSVWLWRDGTAVLDQRVVWMWAQHHTTDEPLDLTHLPAEGRAFVERELQRQRIEGAALPPGAVPVLEGETEKVAGLRLLDEQPERLVRGLIRVHQTDTLNAWHYAAADAALLRAGLDVRENIDTRNELATALRRECRGLRAPENATLDELNEAATAAMEKVTGTRESDTRERVKANPLYLWAEPGPSSLGHELRFTRGLASMLYRQSMSQAEERAKRLARNPAAGIASESLTVLVKTARFGASASKMQGQLSGNWSVLDERGRKVATFTPRLSTAESMQIMAALSNLQVARVMRWAVWGAYRKRFEDEQPDFNRLLVERGFSGLAEALGLAAHGETRKELRLALDALSDLRIETPKGEGRVMTWFETKARGQRAAVLDVSVKGPLAADYLDDDIPRGPERQIVPIPLPQHLPALVGRANEHAAQASLQLLIMRHFRWLADDLARDGNVELSERELRRLLDESGTPGRLLDAVLVAYQTGEGAVPGPPMLVQTGPSRFDLHSGAFSRERASIVAAGRASKQGRARRAKKTVREK